MSKTRIRVLAILFLAEGLFYAGYTVWQTVLNRLEFYRAPPLITSLAYAFFLAMLGFGAFFISRAFMILIREKWLPSDYYVSVCSIFLWALPALMSFGNARTYFTTAPSSLQPYAYTYLAIGTQFAIIGVINILSMILMSVELRKISAQTSTPQ